MKKKGKSQPSYTVSRKVSMIVDIPTTIMPNISLCLLHCQILVFAYLMNPKQSERFSFCDVSLSEVATLFV